MRRVFVILFFLTCGCFLPLEAQHLRQLHFAPNEEADVSRDSLRLYPATFAAYDSVQRVHGSVSMGGGYLSLWGHSMGYGFVAPVLSYDVNERLTISGGFSLAMPMLGTMRHDERSFAPLKPSARRSMHIDAAYRVNDRLSVAASVFYTQGSLMLQLLNPEANIDPYALGVAAAVNYRISDNSYLSLYLEVMRGNGLPPLDFWGGTLYNPYYAISNPYRGFGSPYAYRHFAFGMGDF